MVAHRRNELTAIEYPKNFKKPVLALRWDLYFPDISISEALSVSFFTANTLLIFYFKRNNPVLIFFLSEHCWRIK